MQSVLITGATSMLGAALTKVCAAAGKTVYAVVRAGSDRLARLPASPLVHVVVAEQMQYAELDVSAIHCDVCFHFAWAHTARAGRDDPLLQSANIESTLQAVKLAARCGCSMFVGAGSQAEYGPVTGRISPDTLCQPQMAYGMAKYAAYLLSKRLCAQIGLKHIWGRIFSVYGCNDNDGTMINYAVEQFLKGEQAQFSSAAQMWNYLYEDDAGRMLFLLAERDAESGVYCIAHPESRPLRDYITEIVHSFPNGAACSFASDDAKKAPSVGLDADVQKTLDVTGYLPEVSFSEGIRRVIAAKQEELQRRDSHA